MLWRRGKLPRSLKLDGWMVVFVFLCFFVLEFLVVVGDLEGVRCWGKVGMVAF